MREQSSTAEARVAIVAGRQHGIVTVAQLAACGIDKSAVTRRVRAGRLHRLHRGVYAVGHRSLSWRGRWTAAVLAAGDGAVLSHTSAVGVPAPDPGTGARDRHGHGPPHLAPCARRSSPGTASLISARPDARSDLELLFLALCEDHGLPRPLVNHRVHGRLVDFYRPAHSLAVETDSREYHRGSVAMEDDHGRDLALRAHGIETRRYTGGQLEAEPDAVATDLGAQLTLAGRAISRR